MFQFPPYASHTYLTQYGITGSYSCGVSPFRHVRVNALLAAHRTLSWPIRLSSPACPKASISCPESLIKYLNLDLLTETPVQISSLLLFAYSQIPEVILSRDTTTPGVFHFCFLSFIAFLLDPVARNLTAPHNKIYLFALLSFPQQFALRFVNIC